MKTANISVYGNIAMLKKIALVCLKIDYTIRCLDYICSVSSPVRHQEFLIVKTPTNVLRRISCLYASFPGKKNQPIL